MSQSPDDGLQLMLFWFVLFPGAVWFYLLPWFIAWKRDHPQIGLILVINLFFGWTILGWLAALAWSCSAIDKRT